MELRPETWNSSCQGESEIERKKERALEFSYLRSAGTELFQEGTLPNGTNDKNVHMCVRVI